MSNPKRRSTVHDFATLRLHPDGSRVALSQTNRKSRKSKYTTQDHRGNWIAQDAGGLGSVKTRRAAAKAREESEEQNDEDERDEQGTGPSTLTGDKGNGRALTDDRDEGDVLKDSRAKRRRLFHEDIGVYASGSSQNMSRTQSTASAHEDVPLKPTTTFKPTSDLLKCIHYFASTYYSEMGQLRDSSKEYRKEKKLRRLARLERQAALEANKSADGDLQSEEEESEPSSSEEDESESDDKSIESKAVRSKRKSRNSRRSLPHVGVDMYKIFDGSALMAIGMLLQQHVDSLLIPYIPEGWQEAMADADVPKKQRRKDRMVKMRIMRDDQYDQFFEDEDGEEGEEEGEEEGGEDDDIMPIDHDLGVIDGDMEADEDYIPDDD